MGSLRPGPECSREDHPLSPGDPVLRKEVNPGPGGQRARFSAVKAYAPSCCPSSTWNLGLPPIRNLRSGAAGRSVLSPLSRGAALPRPLYCHWNRPEQHPGAAAQCVPDSTLPPRKELPGPEGQVSTAAPEERVPSYYLRKDGPGLKEKTSCPRYFVLSKSRSWGCNR